LSKIAWQFLFVLPVEYFDLRVWLPLNLTDYLDAIAGIIPVSFPQALPGAILMVSWKPFDHTT